MQGILVAQAVDDRGVVLVDLDALCTAELCDGGILELKTKVGADDLAAGQDGDILEHGLSSVAIAGSLDSDDIKGAS